MKGVIEKTIKVGSTTQVKVLSYHESQYKSVPQIRLSGSWMQALGFNSGDRIKVTASEGRIFLEKIVD